MWHNNKLFVPAAVVEELIRSFMLKSNNTTIQKYNLYESKSTHYSVFLLLLCQSMIKVSTHFVASWIFLAVVTTVFPEAGLIMIGAYRSSL